MQWNNKYIYPKSTRSIVDGSRHYSVNEERLPSVTTILKATESEEKKASLQAWKQRVGHKQAEIITREASSRGSSMQYLFDCTRVHVNTFVGVDCRLLADDVNGCYRL